MGTTNRSRAGLTLLELLLVVFILAAIAASATSVVTDLDGQSRYDDTRSRMAAIRRAIVGPEEAGAPASGFVADIGRRPASIAELVAVTAPAGLTAYQVDSTTGVGAGWRGPYVRGTTRPDGSVELRDGWGTPPAIGLEQDHGWIVAPTGDTWAIVSLGANGVVDAVGAPTVTPYDSDLSDTIVRDDDFVDVGSWSVEVTLMGPASIADIDTDVTVRLWAPDGSGGLVARHSEPLATPLTLNAEQTVVFHFGSGPIWIPRGRRALELYTNTAVDTGTLNDARRAALAAVRLEPRTSLPERVSRVLKAVDAP